MEVAITRDTTSVRLMAKDLKERTAGVRAGLREREQRRGRARLVSANRIYRHGDQILFSLEMKQRTFKWRQQG